MQGFKLLLARVLYGWACRLSGQDLRVPWDQDSPITHAHLHAIRMEQIAREWHFKYHQLRRQKIKAEMRTQRVEI